MPRDNEHIPFETSFLDAVASRLISQEAPLHRCTVLLPSRRAALFLRQALARQLRKPTLAPAIYTSEEWVLAGTGLTLLPGAALLFELYESYQHTQSQPESFDQFIRWGSTLLEDLNEIDRHLVDAPQLFAYLADVKHIENWDPQQNTPEEAQLLQQFLRQWTELPALYRHFREKLRAQGYAYQGLAYRELYRQREAHLAAWRPSTEQLFVVGFNALNKAEEELFDYWRQEGWATFYWDVDRYYRDDKQHEAGLFMRRSRLVRKLVEEDRFYGLHQALEHTPREIHLRPAQGAHQEAQWAQQLLGEGQPDDIPWERTALVLAEEGLLSPLLYQLHENIPAVNITMGLPLAHTELAGYFELLLEMQAQHQQDGRKDEQGRPRYPRRLWEALLAHPASGRAKNQPSLQKSLPQGKAHLSLAELEALGLTLAELKPLLENTHAPTALLAHLAQRAQDMRPAFQKQWLAALHKFFQLFQELEKLLVSYPYLKEVASLRQFYREYLRKEQLDLLGEPLEGLQVMGMLETRTLDFERVVLTSVNEGVLPRGRPVQSLIPYEVKRQFELPTYLDKDAVYAYHFYRLLQRARQVELLYHHDPAGGKEESRLIRQLEMEMAQRLDNTRVIRHALPAMKAHPETELHQVQKTPAMLARLQERLEKGLSPTALRQYLERPEDFYTRYLLGLSDEDPPTDELDARLQGQLLHDALEARLQPFLGAVLPPADHPVYRFKRDQCAAELQTQLQRHAPYLETQRGKNLLYWEDLLRLYTNSLRQEAARRREEHQAPVLKALEKEIAGALAWQAGGTARLKGTADRIQATEEALYVIDYKTGKAEPNNYHLSDLSLEALRQNGKAPALQLLVYGLLAWHDEDLPALPVRSQIYTFRGQGAVLELKVGGTPFEVNAQTAPEVEALLAALIAEIMDPEQALVLEASPEENE